MAKLSLCGSVTSLYYVSTFTLRQVEMVQALPTDSLWRLLSVWPVARLATIGTVGAHLVPVVFAPAQGAIWSAIDGKPKSSKALARVRNLRIDSRYSLLLDAYDDDWTMLWWVRIDGEAVIESGALGEKPEESPGARALAAKYPQYETVPLFSGEPTLLRLAPREHRAWATRGMDWLVREIADFVA